MSLNFPDPNDATEYTEAGITWTWNAQLGVWSSDSNDGFAYLRKDGAAGAQIVQSNDRVIFNGPLTTGHVTLPGLGGPTQAVQRQEVEEMLEALDPSVPGVGDITAVQAGDGLDGGGSIGSVSLFVGKGDGIDVGSDTVSVDNTVVRTTGDQVIAGKKTYTDNIVLPASDKLPQNALRKDEIEELFGYFNVKNFGAIGDGRVDVAGRDNNNDTDAIQAAIDACSAAGGGTVFLPTGIYPINGQRGVDLKPNVHLRGESVTSTILKNYIEPWSRVLGIPGGANISITDLTVDGGWLSRTSGKQPFLLSQNAIRGEGIIFYNNNITPANNFRANNLHIKNTAHYGIGIQNVAVEGAYLTNLSFENSGGDCLDIKDLIDLRKTGITIDNILVFDGCGHNYSADANDGHTNQACLDISSQCTVSNVSIYGLDSYGDSKGAVGVRFRAPKISSSRYGSSGSQASKHLCQIF